MSTLLVLLVTSFLAGVRGEEFTARASIRFPTEDFGKINSGGDAYQSESHLSPLVLHSNDGQPHYILPESPDDHNPFGEVNQKGFSQGYILQEYPAPARHQGEIHHTRTPSFGPARPINNRIIQKVVPAHIAHSYNRHMDRHRFGPPRYNQQSAHYPHPNQGLYSPKPNLKDTKSELSDAIYKFYNPLQHPKYQKQHEAGNPDHAFKGDYKGQNKHPKDYAPEESYFSVHKHVTKPETRYPFKEEKYVGEHEYYSDQEGGERYPSIKQHHTQEQYPANFNAGKKQYPSPAYKQEVFENAETITGSRYVDSKPQYPSLGQFAALDKSGSEWTPINAPEGAVPARSYDLPAPDLSREVPRPERFVQEPVPEWFAQAQRPERFGQEQRPERFVQEQRPERFAQEQRPERFVQEQRPERFAQEQRPERFVQEQRPERFVQEQRPERFVQEQWPERFVQEQRPQRIFYSGRVVDEPNIGVRPLTHRHHKNNGNSEEVVSAVVMVKQ